MDCLRENVGKRKVIRAGGIKACDLSHIFAEVGAAAAIEYGMCS